MEPTITDWISAVASLLGIPSILFGIGRLFVKDKEKQRQLSSLESLAESQALQIEELAKQTAEYQYHSELMKESNEILVQQVELQNEIFLHQRISEEQKISLQEQKRRTQIKPYFVFNGASSNPEEQKIRLSNKGEKALNFRLASDNNELITFRNPKVPQEIDTNTRIALIGIYNRSKSHFSTSSKSYDLTIKYSDIDGNEYEQVVSRNSGGFHVTKPERIKEQIG